MIINLYLFDNIIIFDYFDYFDYLSYFDYFDYIQYDIIPDPIN